MLNKKEIQIFRFVKIIPIFIAFVSFFSIYILYDKNKSHFKSEVDNLNKRVMLEKENLIKGEVLRIYDYINVKKSLTKEKIKESLQARVQGAHTIATSLYKNNPFKSKQEIKKLIIDALKELRFNNGEGYFFIYDSNAINIMHPILPNIKNTSQWDYKDIKGNHPIREMAYIAKEQGEGFSTWWWKKTSDIDHEYKKFGYVKYFSPYDWFIGTGDYVIDSEEALKKEVLQVINKTRYGEDGYIFVIDYEGIILNHIKPDYIGKDMINHKDANGVLVTQALLSIGKSGQGFFSYVASIQPSTGKASRKHSFVIGFDEWQWLIASGAYLDDIEDIITRKKTILNEVNNKELIQNIIFATVLSVVLFSLSLVFINELKKRFLLYQDKMHKKSIALYKLNASLEQFILTRTTALEASNKDLESTLLHLKSTQKKLLESEKMASLGGLVNGMAHELNTPLGIMVTSMSQLEIEVAFLFEKLQQQKLTRKDLERVKQSWALGNQLLSTNLLHSVHLVQNFKSLSTSDDIEDVQIFSIRLLVNSLIDSFSEQFKSLQVTLKVEIKEDIILTSYQWILKEVLTQLIKNTLTHGVQKKITPCIVINIQKIDAEVQLLYSDNGAGSLDIDKIFDPFYTTKRGSDCTGLGLPIVYNQVIHKLLGTIFCTSNDGKGLAFIIKIPINIDPTASIIHDI